MRVSGDRDYAASGKKKGGKLDDGLLFDRRQFPFVNSPSIFRYSVPRNFPSLDRKSAGENEILRLQVCELIFRRFNSKGYVCILGRQRLRRRREDRDHLGDHPRAVPRPPDRRTAHQGQLHFDPAELVRLGDGRLRHLEFRGGVQIPRQSDLAGRQRVWRRFILGVGQQQR